jgi:hypothetical protein
LQAMRVFRATRVLRPCGYFRLVRAKPEETLSSIFCFPFGLVEDILHAVNLRVNLNLPQ